MKHPFQVSIVTPNQEGGYGTVIVARRSTIDRANEQAESIRIAIGNYNRDGVPKVVVTDLRDGAVNA